MEIVKQRVELVFNNIGAELYGSYSECVERAARTCYKSDDKICPGSADKMLKSLIKRQHYAMLEFGCAALQILNPKLDDILTRTIGTGAYIGVRKTHVADESSRSDYKFRTIISGNIRALVHTLVGAYDDGVESEDEALLVTSALRALCVHGGVIEVITAMRPQHRDEYRQEKEKITTLRSARYIDMRAEHYTLTAKELCAHTYITMKYLTDRGVTHELVRHRLCSFAQASTRYINYNGRMQYMLPVWVNPGVMTPAEATGNLSDFALNNNIPIGDMMWVGACTMAEEQYAMLMDGAGWAPQLARDVLNNSLATEILVMANVEEWNHIIDQRSIGTTGKPHPQMQDLARKTHIILREALGEIIRDIPNDGLQLQINEGFDARNASESLRGLPCGEK